MVAVERGGRCRDTNQTSNIRYGSLTTFNILFKNKDDQFRTSAQASAVSAPNA